MKKTPKQPLPDPEKTSEQAAQTFFGAGSDPAEVRAAAGRYLGSALASAGLVPLLFYLRFGEVPTLGWGLTVFFVVYCLLAAVGLYFQPLRQFHTPVALRGGWLDYIAAWWLVSCAFGPFLGWVATSAFPLTPGDWRWLYAARLLLAAGLPVLTALPMMRYLRGKAVLVALPILLIVTSLPVWSAVDVGRDLWSGPLARQSPTSGETELYLPHTQQSLGKAP